jgi:hypothetical protein
MTTAWESKIPAVTQRMEGDATRSGLKAAGELVKARIIKRLEEGYTTGFWVTGRVAKSVKRNRPGAKAVKITCPNPVAVEWELGHYNIFTRRQERVEVFRPATEEHPEDVAREFARRYIEKLEEILKKAALKAAA